MKTLSPEEAVKPLAYVVLFHADEEQEDYSPIVIGPGPLADGATIPGLLSDELVPALPSVWYCLHLPRHLTDAWDMLPRQIEARLSGLLPHRIVLMPAAAAPRLLASMPSSDLHIALLVGPDDLRHEMEQLAERHSSLLGARCYGDLTPEMLRDDWRCLGALARDIPLATGPGVEPTILSDVSSVALQVAFLSHQFPDAPPVDFEDVGDAIMAAIRLRAIVGTLARQPPPGNDAEMSAAIDEEARLVKFSVALAVPGSAPQHRRLYPPPRAGTPAESEQTQWPQNLLGSSDEALEGFATTIMLTHEALASSSLALSLEECSSEAFVALSQLEEHWIHNPNPAKVWRLLRRMGAALEPAVGPYGQLIRRSEEAVCFSNFPVGLATLPGSSSPMMLEVPFAHRPLVPFTRVLPRQVLGASTRPLGLPLRVLIIDCIEPGDPVGEVSREVWHSTSSHEGMGGLDIQVVSAMSVNEFKRVVHDSDDVDVLVISAHGFYEKSSNVSGFVVGRERLIGHDLDHVPPLVLLSACHVSPRGAGSVTVVDLLLRAGATAVLGTMVPVDVRHNSILMARLLLHISGSSYLRVG